MENPTLQKMIELQTIFWQEMCEQSFTFDGVKAFVSNIQDLFLNLAICTKPLTMAAFKIALQEIQSFFHSSQVPWTIWINPLMGTAIQEWLVKIGLKPLETISSMCNTLENLKLIEKVDFEIIEVKTWEELREWFHPIQDGFEVPEGNEEFLHLNEKKGYGNDRAFHHYIGRWKGECVTAATFYVHQRMAMLHNVATRKPFRNQGFASALVSYIVRQAKLMECLYCTLDATLEVAGLYNNLGWRQCFLNTVFQGSGLSLEKGFLGPLI